MISRLLIDAFFAALAGMGFAIAFNPRIKLLLLAGVFAGTGHALRLWLMVGCDVNICLATVAGAFVIGLLGFLAGRIIGCPAEIFTFPAVLPMIPGLYAYKTIWYASKFLEENTASELSEKYLHELLHYGLLSSSVMLAIVLGAAMSVFIDTLSSRIEHRNAFETLRTHSRRKRLESK